MGNCFGRQKQPDGFVVDTRKRSFSKRIDLWEKTGTVAFRSSSLQVRGCCDEVMELRLSVLTYFRVYGCYRSFLPK